MQYLHVNYIDNHGHKCAAKRHLKQAEPAKRFGTVMRYLAQLRKMGYTIVDHKVVTK